MECKISNMRSVKLKSLEILIQKQNEIQRDIPYNIKTLDLVISKQNTWKVKLVT